MTEPTPTTIFECGVLHLRFNPEGDPDRGVFSVRDEDPESGDGTEVSCPKTFGSRRNLLEHMLFTHSPADLLRHLMAVREGRVDPWGKTPEPERKPGATEHQVDDAIAASYLRDVTIVVNNDRRLANFAKSMVFKAKETAYPTEEQRAQYVGARVKDSFTNYLTEAQQEDPLGRLLVGFLAHVSTTDLGFYYLEQYKGK
jgi:hypothetical protein